MILRVHRILQKLENEGCLDEYSRKAMRGSKLDDDLVKKWPCMHSETGGKKRSLFDYEEPAKAPVVEIENI